MNTRFKTFLFVLLVIKAIISTQAQAPLSYDNDVTKHLDGWVGKLLKTGTDTFKKLFSKISTQTLKDFNFDIGKEISPLGNRFQFRDVYMNVSEFKAPQLHWKFSESKMLTILKPSSTPYTEFETHLDLENVTFTLAITPEDKTSITFTQDKSWLWYNGEKNWEVRFHHSDNDESPENRRRELEEELLPAATALLRENFNQNEQFSKNIRTIFGDYSESREKLIQTHSDFFTNQEKYYYLIPKIPFFCFNLKNILIKGLTNLEWIKINTGLSIFTHTLMIRNVHGDLILDFGAAQEKPVELKFKIDYFSVSTDRKSVNVEARYSSVNKTSTPLSSRQSALIIHSIESATANSLFPALQLRRTFNIDTPPGEIKITDKTDWESIKQSFCEWIPFNEDETRPLDTETRSKAYQCGVQTTKTSLELPYKSFKKEFREPEVKNKILQNTEKIPADIHERFLDLDHWTVVEVPTFMINTKSSIASTNNSDYNEIKDMPDKQEQKFKNYFGAWLYIITSKYNDVKLQEFQTKLKNAYESSTFKGTEEEFYMRCAAHLARTFLQVCAVHHYWIQYIMNNEDINTTFEETLVRIIPSWDFSEEQITIVNILRTVVYNDKNGALEYSKTTNALGDETCVFFDQTERCK